MRRKPIELSPSVEQMIGDAAGRYQGHGHVYFIELKRL